ncbi:MAG: hypothetical protein CMN85_08885 [Spongiibacteraceae bacterium]|nr:hypothetical protein [Spongiibacteraceae bacterium]|tara:strand:+ start:1291 stop:1716 length:426 start_codon:yes stop_codon:yes gene_type:complete
MPLNPAWIFVPVLIQLTLTIVLYFLLARRKRKAAEAGEVNEARRGIYDDAWPESVILVNNCIRNQFELPVLFYVVILSLWSLNAVNWLVLALAGLFAISRLVHAYIHTGSNVVPVRRRIFIFGVLLVAALCVLLGRAIAMS